MEIKFVVVLLTSCASIAVALVSLISNYLNNRELNKAKEGLEILKFKIEKERQKYQILDESLKKRLTAIGEHIKYIQGFKDYLFFVENCLEDSLDTETALSQIKKLREEMFLCYKDNNEHIEDESLKAAHSAKNHTWHIENKLKELSHGKEYMNLSKAEKDSLESDRLLLTEFQNILRDKSYELRDKRHEIL